MVSHGLRPGLRAAAPGGEFALVLFRLASRSRRCALDGHPKKIQKRGPADGVRMCENI